jgi:hypothetical protein
MKKGQIYGVNRTQIVITAFAYQTRLDDNGDETARENFIKVFRQHRTVFDAITRMNSSQR